MSERAIKRQMARKIMEQLMKTKYNGKNSQLERKIRRDLAWKEAKAIAMEKEELHENKTIN